MWATAWPMAPKSLIRVKRSTPSRSPIIAGRMIQDSSVSFSISPVIGQATAIAAHGHSAKSLAELSHAVCKLAVPKVLNVNASSIRVT